MSTANQKQLQKIETKFTLPENIPITYLWFGKSVPEDYLISLAELDFPVIFLKNPKLGRSFTRQLMEVQKSDYYRLQYLYNQGGIYSDFDNIINYSCLMEMLQPFRTQGKLVFQSVGKHTRKKMKEMTNGMIFAPQKNMPILKKMLDGVDERKKKIWDFAGLSYLGKFSEPVEYDMSRCVIHTGDWSWFKDSNAVLKKSTAPHQRFARKLIKKKDFLMQQEYLIDNLYQIKQENKKQLNEFYQLLNNDKKVSRQITSIAMISLQKQMPSQAQSIGTLENIQFDSYLDIVKSNAQVRERLDMKSYITSLQKRNAKLKFEKDSIVIGIWIFSVLLVAMIALALFTRKKTKKRVFTSQPSTQLQ